MNNLEKRPNKVVLSMVLDQRRMKLHEVPMDVDVQGKHVVTLMAYKSLWMTQR